MKKIISAILTSTLILTNASFNVNAREKFSIYTKVDLSKFYNSKVYLSESEAGTYTEETANRPDFFIRANQDVDYGEPYAISKESAEKFINNNEAVFNGVPYYLETKADKGGVDYSLISAVPVPVGYYSAFKVLSVTAPIANPAPGVANDNSIYTSLKYSDGSLGSLTNKGGLWATDMERAKVYSSDEFSDVAKVIEYTFEVRDKSKQIKSIALGAAHQNKSFGSNNGQLNR